MSPMSPPPRALIFTVGTSLLSTALVLASPGCTGKESGDGEVSSNPGPEPEATPPPKTDDAKADAGGQKEIGPAPNPGPEPVLVPNIEPDVEPDHVNPGPEPVPEPPNVNVVADEPLPEPKPEPKPEKRVNVRAPDKP